MKQPISLSPSGGEGRGEGGESVTLSTGTKLGPYEILAPLGAGGMGEVYRARDSRLERTVAVKVLPERLAQDPDALSRFGREAKAVAALSHPNILAIHDFGHEGTVAYAVSELLEGETLREALSSGPLSPRKVREYGVQIALGLAAAHEKGIVHRDLKPDNIFITRDERLKILHFGLAKPGAGSPDPREETQSPTVSGYTEPGTVMGTVGYMSPEQVRGVPVDQRSDIFSFGAVLYEMLTGSRAFQRETAAETMTAILKEEPQEPAVSLGAGASALLPVLRHCLEKKPEKRFQSARDLAFALETASVATSSAVAAVEPARERSSLLWRSLGISALVCGAAIAGYFLHLGRAAAPETDRGDATLTPLTTDPGYEESHVLARRADDRLRLGSRWELRGLPPADLRRPRAQSDTESRRGRPAGLFSRWPGDRLRLESLEQLGPHARRPRPAARRRRHLGDARPRWAGAPDRRERGLSVLDAGRRGPSLRSRHLPERSDRAHSGGGRGKRDIPIDEPLVLRYFYPRLSGDGRWLLLPERHPDPGGSRGGRKAERSCPRRGPRLGARIGECPLHEQDSGNRAALSGRRPRSRGESSRVRRGRSPSGGAPTSARRLPRTEPRSPSRRWTRA